MVYFCFASLLFGFYCITFCFSTIYLILCDFDFILIETGHHERLRTLRNILSETKRSQDLTTIVANEELKADLKETENELERGTSNTITNTFTNSNANPTTATASIEYEHQKKASLDLITSNENETDKDNNDTPRNVNSQIINSSHDIKLIVMNKTSIPDDSVTSATRTAVTVTNIDHDTRDQTPEVLKSNINSKSMSRSDNSAKGGAVLAINRMESGQSTDTLTHSNSNNNKFESDLINNKSNNNNMDFARLSSHSKTNDRNSLRPSEVEGKIRERTSSDGSRDTCCVLL